MSLSCPRVQPRICRTTEAHGVALAKLADVLGSFTCKYCLFSQLLIFFSWRFINVQMGESASHPPHQHNVCTEAQSSLRRRDSQTSRRGAKPVALSTRESLGVFNSLSYHFFLILYACMRGVCVCAFVFMRVHYPTKSFHVIFTILQYVLLVPLQPVNGSGCMSEIG